ncbi:MAG TPA: hypothetical protein VI456_09585 [Polyangia bacterium]
MITFRCPQKVRDLLGLRDRDLSEETDGDLHEWFIETATIERYLRAHHHPFPDKIESFPGAGHAYLTARDGLGAAINSSPMGGGARMVCGGTPLRDTSAAQTALALIDTFLSRPDSAR